MCYDESMKNKTNTPAVTLVQTNEDFKMSLIIVSVGVNLFVLTTWMVAQLSSDYAAQLATLI